MVEPIRVDSVSRRTVLKGMAGAAGLISIPAIIAACGSSSSSATPSAAASVAPSEAAPSVAPSEAAPSVAAGSITLGSNYSDPVPKGVLAGIVDTFTQQTGITVKINTVDHGTFQDQISSYLQGTPDDVFTWFSGFRMRFFAAQGLATDISDVWSKVGGNYSDAFKVGSTGDDGKQYFIPIYNYPWAVFYRKSVFADKGYTPPTTLDEFKTLAAKMKADGLIPMAFGDSDGWPAMGTFDILNLRQNGYDFHVGLMAGTQKWTDPKVKEVFTIFKDLLPYYQNGAAGRTWQDAAQALVQKKAGMYLLGMFVSQQFQEAGDADLADLDFFPYPNFGTQYDAEKALDAPIDGFMISANSSSLQADLDAAKAFMEYLAQPATQVAWVSQDKGNVAAAKDADTSGYTPLQKKAAELIGGAQRITQFLDRDTNPNFAGANGMQAFLLDFLKTPDQDLDAFLKKIQDFWDTL
ncbi:MAG: carbohydrate ABC transporter substrate-binding protein [Chloroflexi bacterium]|nr:carbohydrate ABC transporter substrate-binding protein [Chloroflexota bacterium]